MMEIGANLKEAIEAVAAAVAFATLCLAVAWSDHA